MPRLARLDAPGVLHHVMGRRIERRKIFLSEIDRNDFINRLSTPAPGWHNGNLPLASFSLAAKQ